MGLIFLFQVLVVQAVLIAIIIFVLKRTLDKKLIEAAVIRLEGLDHLPDAGRVKVRSHRKVKSLYKERIEKAILKNFRAGTAAVFEIDRSLMGGVIIDAGGESIDCSLRDRLRQAFGRP